MTSRERILSAWNGRPVDHIPLTTWCFGFVAPSHLRWKNNGREVKHWYSMRLEHLHTLPEPWGLEDDFKRVLAWRSMGLDDILDVSIPWSIDPEVQWQDYKSCPDRKEDYPVLVRAYETPSGNLRHAVRQTGEDTGVGWVIQPQGVPLFEDYNIPRAIGHVVSEPDDIPAIRHLYRAPDNKARAWFSERMGKLTAFSGENGIAVQAWSAFGMDAMVWLMGTEGAIIMAMDEPRSFGELLDIITETDLARTELAASTSGVDMVVQRGWYSATDFWSPKLFDQMLYPRIKELSDTAHKHGKKFGYVMTTGVEILGPRLADAGVDVLYFVDPIQDGVSIEKIRELLADRMTLVGGTNALSLASGNRERIRDEVRKAIDVLGSTNRFILHPVDAIFPDTPWEGIELLVEAWNDYK